MAAHTCNPSTWEAEAGDLWAWAQLGLYSETLSQKTIWAGSMAQAVEHLPSKYTAQSSNPSTDKNKEKKKN
jgi:2-oxoglutarate dehydrogenase complex dehydrogenase (E1) component-like enzyme